MIDLLLYTLAFSSQAYVLAACDTLGTVVITPHDKYSSSAGVLGCKINTNRVAYWPTAVDCDNICIRLDYIGRSIHVLHVDASAEAHDISYDAWNYLAFGTSATVDPHFGGGVTVDYQFVPADECRGLMVDGKLPLSAANSMDFLMSCLHPDSTWVSRNYQLFNIQDPTCQYGYDEVCQFNLSASDQPQCAQALGSPHRLAGLCVTNIVYGSGQMDRAC